VVRVRDAPLILPELIEGDALTLRRWSVADAAALADAVTESVEHLRPWMRWMAQEPVSIAERRAMLAEREREWSEGGDVMLGVFLDGGVVGGCGLHRRLGPNALELGYWIHRAFVRRGLGTEVARLLTASAFTLPAIERVEIHHDKANEASAGIPRRLGFSFVGEAPDDHGAPAEVGIECIWRMRRSDWERAARRRAAVEDLARAGTSDAHVELVEYDPAWPGMYDAERRRLSPLLGGARLHHFGSTSVPGLLAKPVIDMIALVDDLDAPIGGLVACARYKFPEAFNATLRRRRFLCYPSSALRTHHLHLVDDAAELRMRLRFRDRLRADGALARDYAALKRRLAELHRTDREAYTDAKSEFIRTNSVPA
jgi:GrpB-like predicted nucleotidyltransferase (UPF0157 family)/RimJ/RimL family protein N-acetyltransferase